MNRADTAPSSLSKSRLMLTLPRKAVLMALLACVVGAPVVLGAQEPVAAAPAIDGTKVAMDTMWTLITAFLVFFMNLGFAMVE